MRRMSFAILALAICLAASLPRLTARAAAGPLADMTAGAAHLTSAGPLAFGPDGILFVGDSAGASVVAIDTNDRTAAKGGKIDVQGLDEKIAALAGAAAADVIINDMAVNPISKNVYVSASRGHGPDAMPLIARVDAAGKVTLLALDNVKHEAVSFADAPASNPSAGDKNPRTMTITDMQYVNGNLMIAGLSNEEWSSALRSVPFPFKNASKGATLQIWHSSHGKYETQSPIRTFVPYTIAGQQYVLAAYTCTPLVKIPVSSLKPGAEVKGMTIADLGSGNQPLDMVPYKKDGHNYILVANSAFGMYKLKADNLESYAPIDSPTVVDVAGVPFDKIASPGYVAHLAPLDEANAVMLVGKRGAGPVWQPGPAGGPVSLQTIALP